MIKNLLSVIFTVSICALAAGAEPEKQADDLQTIVLFTDTRPVLIHIHVRVDGRPLHAAWDQLTRKVFESLDLNKDGILSRGELKKLPPPQVLVGADFDFEALDEGATLDQLRDYYRRNGGEPFQVITTSSPVVESRAAALNEALFNLLDTNKDGKLSKEELAMAPAILLRKDVNDDEMVDAFELVGARSDEQIQRRAQSDKGRVDDSLLRVINPGEPPSQLARELLTHYGPKGQTRVRKLTAKEIGLDEATFKLLDVDENGELDNEELMRFCKRRPDVELMVQFGNTERDKPRLEIRSTKDQPLASKLQSPKDGALVLDFDLTRVELQIESIGAKASRKAIRDRYLLLFADADTDNNGYLDRNEARQSPTFRDLFTLMDADGDGKLFEKEMLAYLDHLADLQAEAMAAVVILSGTDKSHGLFDLIDANRDGRLSLREMRNAVNLIKVLDRDGDGKISKTEFLRIYQLTLAHGANADRIALDEIDGVRKRFTGAPDPRAPLWFQKMDLNGDGDLSRREFLGTAQQFKEIDLDGDGLISVDEAIAFEKKRRR